MTLQEIESKRLAGLPLSNKEQRKLDAAAKNTDGTLKAEQPKETPQPEPEADDEPTNRFDRAFSAVVFTPPTNNGVFGADDAKAKNLSRALAKFRAQIAPGVYINGTVYAKKSKATGDTWKEANFFGTLTGNCLTVDDDAQTDYEAFRKDMVVRYDAWAAGQTALGKPTVRKAAAHTVPIVGQTDLF